MGLVQVVRTMRRSGRTPYWTRWIGSWRVADDLLGPTARRFLTTSLERQRATRRWLRRRRTALVGSLVLVTAAITAVTVAHRHESARDAALRSERLIADAKALSSDPDLA